MGKNDISKATLGRIPVYLRYLKNLPYEIQTISSTVIARELGFGEVQVRKDLALLDSVGKPKIGYIREELITSLEKFLGCKNGGAVVVGAGKLGTALLSYDGFSEYGCNVLAAFDNKYDTTQTMQNGKKAYPVSYAVITDEQSGVKYPLADYELLPNMAIIDTDFHMSAPRGLTAASGIDAVTHALEAYCT